MERAVGGHLGNKYSRDKLEKRQRRLLLLPLLVLSFQPRSAHHGHATANLCRLTEFGLRPQG